MKGPLRPLLPNRFAKSISHSSERCSSSLADGNELNSHQLARATLAPHGPRDGRLDVASPGYPSDSIPTTHRTFEGTRFFSDGDDARAADRRRHAREGCGRRRVGASCDNVSRSGRRDRIRGAKQPAGRVG